MARATKTKFKYAQGIRELNDAELYDALGATHAIKQIFEVDHKRLYNSLLSLVRSLEDNPAVYKPKMIGDRPYWYGRDFKRVVQPVLKIEELPRLVPSNSMTSTLVNPTETPVLARPKSKRVTGLCIRDC